MGAQEYDFIVVGGGSGGLAASKRAASYGAKVAIVEHSRVGGTCVIRGCIPKKLMVYAANLGKSRHLSQAYGWKDSLGDLDWGALASFRNGAVSRLEEMHETNLTKAGVTLVRGKACFISPTEIQVEQQVYRAKKFLIATGSTPWMPSIEGIDLALSSDGFWQLTERPASVTIVGGGYIAVEFASILHHLGCQTTLLVRSTLLRGFDSSLGEHLHHCLTQQGVIVQREATIERLSQSESGLEVSATVAGTPSETKCDAVVIFATGRHPNIEGLGLAQAGVETTSKAAIAVNEQHATSAPNIFAVGDVLGHSMLTPVAIKAGRSVADREFGSRESPMSYETIPTAIFSHPPVGTVGLSQTEAVAQYGEEDVSVYQAAFNPLLYSPCKPEEKIQTFMKLIVRTSTDHVLGFHMVGDDAPEIIQGFAAALMAGITKTQLDLTVAIHPSAAEEFVLMG